MARKRIKACERSCLYGQHKLILITFGSHSLLDSKFLSRIVPFFSSHDKSMLDMYTIERIHYPSGNIDNFGINYVCNN